MSSSGRPTVAVAFHSGYGHTAVIAETVARGATDAILFGAKNGDKSSTLSYFISIAAARHALDRPGAAAGMGVHHGQ
ncbi:MULTISPECIES: hypothetical protein [unclassified Streptomyces]|uniref:hypothetical protein n=1 Tax=unclassified Streptomyces TaxID=2593676 RepID=UPI002B1CD3BF|nr:MULTISPECIES: hypothetical protein [unclassified Streptomyces]